MEPPLILVSYSQADEIWCDRLRKAFAPLVRNGKFTLWDESRIQVGAIWEQEIEEVLYACHVAILLVSVDYLASDFIATNTLPPILEQAKTRGTLIVWIPIGHCLFEETPLAHIQAVWYTKQPLNRLKESEQDDALVEIARKVRELLISPEAVPKAKKPNWFARLRKSLLSENQRKEELLARGEDLSEVNKSILQLKQEIRYGHFVEPNDMLSNRYRLVAEIGKGGFGIVWKARDRSRDNSFVAVKVLHDQLSRAEISRDRFLRGARKMASIDNEHIVKVFEPSGNHQGTFFYVMEYHPDGDLFNYVLDRRLEPEHIVPTILAIGEGLQFAHEHGLIHRDIKPQNILIGKDGKPIISDFDLVYAEDTVGGTRTGAMGSYIYSAPEVMTDAKNPNAVSDLYSLAMVSIFCFLGMPLPPDVIPERRKIITGLDCNDAEKNVLARASAWNKRDRFHSVAEFCKALNTAFVEGKAESFLEEPTQEEVVLRQRILDLELKVNASERSALWVHEVKNQFALIRVSLERLEDDLIFEEYDRAKSRLNQLCKTVAGLGQLSKSTSSFNPLKIDEKHTLSEIISTSLKRHSEFFRARQIQIDLKQSDLEVTSNVSSETLAIVMDNLLINAADAINFGASIRIRLIAKEPYLKLAISNPGQIPQDISSKLFDRGFTTKRGGTGNGLYLCREAIRREAGDLSTDLSEKGFVTMIVTIPRAS